MSIKRRFAHTPVRLLSLAVGISVVMTLQVAVASGLFSAWPDAQVATLASVLLQVYLTGSVLAVFNANNMGQGADAHRMAAALAGVGLALVAGVEVSFSTGRLPASVYLALALVGETLTTYSLATLAMGCFKLSGPWQQRPPVVAASIVLAAAALSFMGESFVTLTAVPAGLGLLRDVVMVGMVACVVAAVVVMPGLRLDQKSHMNSLKMRLPIGDGDTKQFQRLTLWGVVCGSLAGIALQVGLRLFAPEAPVHGFAAALCPAWLGALLGTWLDLKNHTVEQRQGQATARLATQSARRFLKRYLNEKEAWAATVGIRTTNFHIDHDPSGQLSLELPASVNQIRAEEIQRCVTDVLAAMHLHSHVVGQRIFGALDPEHAIRPCVDTLKMFACLYLDAGPLVERRIKGLLALLPIVDPGLARILKPKDIGSLIRRNLWFFHYEFGWIDQHLIHTPRHTRYDVRIAALSSRIRQSMMEYLDKTGGFGNFVWIGPEARDRLLQEAPILSNIIEPCPIIDTDENGKSKGPKDELLMFIIKFEQLIPRLQRYFDLDTMRRSLMDFEPSPESLRLQNLLGLQINKASDPAQVLDALASITTVPWRGFKEKDTALQLVLQAHIKLSEILTPGQSLVDAAAKNPKAQAMHERLLDAVRLIGYPSQILHNAQVSKLALRDVKTLIDVAGNERHARFEEAWLLMATADYQRYKPEQRIQLMQFLQGLSGKSRLIRERLVQMKCVDAIAGLGRVAGPNEFKDLGMALDKTAMWMAKQVIDPDIACLLLDTYLFLTMHQNRPVTLGAPAVQALEAYLAHLEKDMGANHPRVVSVMSRWRECRTATATPNTVITAA